MTKTTANRFWVMTASRFMNTHPLKCRFFGPYSARESAESAMNVLIGQEGMEEATTGTVAEIAAVVAGDSQVGEEAIRGLRRRATADEAELGYEIESGKLLVGDFAGPVTHARLDAIEAADATLGRSEVLRVLRTLLHDASGSEKDKQAMINAIHDDLVERGILAESKESQR